MRGICSPTASAGLILMSTVFLSSCASFSGAQRPLKAKHLQNSLTELAKGDFEKYDHKTDPAERKAIRNATIVKFMIAIDDRYDAFTAQVAQQMHGTNLGLDLGILGLTAAGSVVGSASSKLSAAAAGLTGTRASFSKELYIERTLPAIHNVIAEHMRLPDSDYGLAEGLMEVREYERAGNLNRALTSLASNAERQFVATTQEYRDALPSCEPTAALTPIRKEINQYLYGIVKRAGTDIASLGEADGKALDRLQAFMAANKLSPADRASTPEILERQVQEATRYLARTCTEAETTAAKAAIEGQGQ